VVDAEIANEEPVIKSISVPMTTSVTPAIFKSPVPMLAIPHIVVVTVALVTSCVMVGALWTLGA
jgi:hypothetical protein